MAVNAANARPGDLVMVAGEGIEIEGNVISNAMLPPSAILDNTITDPATVTDFGGAYIVPATGAVGAWAGKANQIATTADSGASWAFTTPVANMRRQVTGGVNAGTVYRWSGTAWVSAVSVGQPVGTVLKTQIFNGTEVTASATANFSTTTLSVTYTPVSATSYLLIEVDGSFTLLGYGTDAWQSRLRAAGTLLQTKQQSWLAQLGGGTRAGVVLPIRGRYTNSTTAAKSIQVIIERLSGDDNMNLDGTNRNIVITEIQR